MIRGLLLAASLFFSASSFATAGIIYESATLGPTGFTHEELHNDPSIPHINIKPTVFTGVRFYLDQPAITSQIGGHIIRRDGETIFGALVKLDGEDDFPDSHDFSSGDVLGAAILTPPDTSVDLYSDLTISLEPGWHALVFGSSLFGASGRAFGMGNNQDIGNPDYIGYQPGGGWYSLSWLPSTWENYRFVVRGTVIPEPTTLALSGICIAMLVTRWKRAVI